MEKNTGAIVKWFLFLGTFFLYSIIYSQEKKEKYLSEDERIFSVVYRTDAKTQSSRSDWRKKSKVEEITYLIRMPSAWTKEKNEMAEKSKTPCVRGVIAICTCDKEPERMRKNLSYWNSEFKYLIQFADDNNIAVITWTNFGGYLISTVLMK